MSSTIPFIKKITLAGTAVTTVDLKDTDGRYIQANWISVQSLATAAGKWYSVKLPIASTTVANITSATGEGAMGGIALVNDNTAGACTIELGDKWVSTIDMQKSNTGSSEFLVRYGADIESHSGKNSNIRGK